MERVSLFEYGALGAHSNLRMAASTWNLKQLLLAILVLFPAEKVANVSSYLVFGVWCLVFGVWCLVFGVWCLVFGVW